MAVVLTDCRKALVGTGWTFLLPFSTNGFRNRSPTLVGPISDTVVSFQSGEAFVSSIALTI